MSCLELSNEYLWVNLGDQGARVLDVQLREAHGPISVVCGYEAEQQYHDDTYYLGATVGPIANRVRNGQFILEGRNIQLPQNHGQHCLHSGDIGVDSKYWSGKKINNSVVEYSLMPELAHLGFPTELTLLVRYTLDQAILRIEQIGTCSGPAYLNLTNHTYWNLNQDSKPITNHSFELYANALATKDQDDIPTGQTQSVDNPFHLQLNQSSPIAEISQAVDHHFIVDETSTALKPFARITSPSSGVSMQVRSTKPGFQLYSGHFLDTPLAPYSGFCVEPQYVPNAINLPQFKAPLTTSETPYHHTMEFEFTRS